MASAEDSMTRSRDKRRALDAERKRRLIVAIAGRIIAHVDELTALDAAIGDGDHGHNMRRGFEAVLQDLDALEAMGLSDLLKAIGTKLVMKVGGASGPLYGTLFLALGKALPDEPSREEAAAAFVAAIAAVRARGKSEQGQKTMLDVLIPTCRAFSEGGDLAAVKKAGGGRGRSDDADARDPRSRFIPRRAIDRPYGSRRAVVFADDRGALR